MLYHDDLTKIEEIARRIAKEEIDKVIRAAMEPTRSEPADPNAEPADPNAEKEEDNA